MEGQNGNKMTGWINAWTEAQRMDDRKIEWKEDDWMDEWIEGQMMDGRKDGKEVRMERCMKDG